MKVGQLRIKLAALLAAALPDVAIKPEELDVIPYSEARRKTGAAAWFALTKYTDGRKCDIQSWHTMKECVQRGIGRIVEGEFCDFEIEPKDEKQDKNSQPVFVSRTDLWRGIHSKKGAAGGGLEA